MIPVLPLAQASAAAYAEPTFYASNMCQVALSVIEGVATFAFRGTADFMEWLVDFMALEIPALGEPFGPVHAGFWADSYAARAAIAGWLALHGDPPFRFTGHSKGAGEAILAHADFKAAGRKPLPTWVFEPPHVGSSELVDYLAGEVAWTQTVNQGGRDIVTVVPGGPPVWAPLPEPHALTVPDGYGVKRKHVIETVIAGLA